MAANRQGSQSITRKINALKALKTELPIILANDCVNFFKQSFRKQGWDDGGLQKWQPRKNNEGNKGKAILTQSGDLKNSIVAELATFNKIKIVSKLPYSAIHNEGLKGRAFGKHSFKMPKRKFMGKSRTLENKLKKKIEDKLNIAFRK